MQRCFYGWKSKKLISIIQGLFPDGSSGYRQPEECLNREEEVEGWARGDVWLFHSPATSISANRSLSWGRREAACLVFSLFISFAIFREKQRRKSKETTALIYLFLSISYKIRTRMDFASVCRKFNPCLFIQWTCVECPPLPAPTHCLIVPT